MPEENFEQQARQKAEQFNMEPKPEVWQRVQAAIAPEKRRRRLLVWWWLLPAGIAVGMAVYFANQPNILPSDKVAATLNNTRNETKNETQSVIKEKENHQAVVNSYSPLYESGRKENKEKKNTPGLFEKKKGNKVIRQLNEVTNNEYQEIKKEEKEKYSAQLSGQKEKAVFSPDSVHKAAPALISNELELPDDIIKTDTIATTIVKDSLQLKRDTVIAIDKKKDNKKKINNKSWQFGMLAEIGISSRGKSLFRFNNNESKIFDAVPTIPQNNSGGVSSDSNLSGNNRLVYQTIQHGVDAAVGASVQKVISHRFYISGQFSYRYQQYTVRNMVRDSTFVNGTFSGAFANFPAGDDNYHLHFLNLFAGVGWQYFAGKKSTFSVEMGLDNSLLITMKQRKQDQSSRFNLVSSGSSDISGFYRWQPQANIALPVAFQTSQVRWQVSPFARFGLHSLQKNNSSYKDNHLVSAGIQAIYFFK